MRALLITLSVVVLTAALAFGWWLGSRDDAPVAGPTPAPTVADPAATVDPTLTFSDLIDRARPDDDGQVAVSVTEAELTTAANNDLPADAPVDRVDLGLVEQDGQPVVRFSTELADSGLDVTGALTLDLVDGRVRPELDDVRAGPFPVPGPLRGPVEDVASEARRFFTALADRGVRVTSLDIADDALFVDGVVRAAAG